MLAGTASAFYLFGMAVIYADTGTMDLAQVAAAVGKPGLLVPVGLALIIVGLGFKLSVVPFHLWTPDVYDGAPAPVTAFIASVSKGATAVLLARFLLPAIGGPTGALFWTFAVISVASMFLGNILALREDNIKRILAYSSIAHLGYLLIGFLSGGPDAVRAISFYLLAYFITIIACFAVVAGLSRTDREANRLEDYRGLASRRPWLAGAFTAGLLSLAGLPLTAGFVGKFIIVAAGAGAALWILAVILAVNSTISIFYYLRVVSAMFRPPEPAMAGLLAGETGGAAAVRVPFLAGLTVAALTLAVIALGIYPSPVLRVIGLFAGG
jgi:NADH-quinone oxidoreductase subunit N